MNDHLHKEIVSWRGKPLENLSKEELIIALRQVHRMWEDSMAGTRRMSEIFLVRQKRRNTR